MRKLRRLEIKTDQLLPQGRFIYYCNHDPANSYTGGRMEINERLLRAAEKDELIKPILQVEGKVRQDDGTEKEGLVNYYSTHQIYILAELKGNSVNADGYLDDLNTKGVKVGEQELRFIRWGGDGAFSANSSRRNADNDDIVVNAYKVSDYLHSFLQLLHSLEPIPRHQRSEEKQRYWSDASILEYNFEPLKNGGKKLLKTYGLDEKRLIILRRNIGYFAEAIDPLAHWRYYIKRHPEWKKDLLKGDASLAQEIYRLYDLLTEVWEVVTGEKSEPIFEFLHKDFSTQLDAPKTKYLHGEDIKALKYSVEQFKKWRRKKDNKPFVGDEITKKINAVGKELAEYEKTYGDRSYAGSMRSINEEDAIEFDKLDPHAKQYAEMILHQREKHKGVKPSEQEIKQEVAYAIMSRLGDLQRELRQIFSGISGQFREKENAAWQIVNDWGSRWWSKNRDKLEGLSREEQLKFSSVEREKVEKEAKDWRQKSKDFCQTVSGYAEVVFCSVCRKERIKASSENSFSGMEPRYVILCDVCKDRAREDRLLSPLPSPLRCHGCRKVLYRFVGENELAEDTELFKKAARGRANGQTFTKYRIALDYGRMHVHTVCGWCGEINEFRLDHGWGP